MDQLKKIVEYDWKPKFYNDYIRYGNNMKKCWSRKHKEKVTNPQG